MPQQSVIYERKSGLAGIEQVAHLYIGRGMSYEDFLVGLKYRYAWAHEYMGDTGLDVAKLGRALREAGYGDEDGAVKRLFRAVEAQLAPAEQGLPGAQRERQTG